jgi:hypothetical protein
LDSSGSFERHEKSPADRDVPKLADTVRTRGHRGGVIPMHRALAHFQLNPMSLVTAIFLFVFFTLIWLVLLPRVCYFWNSVLAFGIRVLPLHAELGLAQNHLTRFISFDIPYLRLEPVLPSPQIWWLTLAATLALLAVSFVLPGKLIPVTYLLRGILLVPATALAYFAILPARFPHTPDSYMQGLVTAGIALISSVPLLFGLTFYIFDFGLLKKAFLTAITMMHLALFLPLQVLMQALFLQKTVLFMPVLYNYLRHAYKHSDHRRFLFVGHELVLPVGCRGLIGAANRDRCNSEGPGSFADRRKPGPITAPSGEPFVGRQAFLAAAIFCAFTRMKAKFNCGSELNSAA